MKPSWVVAITGASGVQFSIRLIQVLNESEIPVDLIVSESARLVFNEEMGISGGVFKSNEVFCGTFKMNRPHLVNLHAPKDFTAPIASGSYPTQGMIIVPCSMGTLGAISAGMSQNLIHRAADCMMKEGRPLLIVPRETPLSAIHLENMLKLSRLGVKVIPPMPGFYSGGKTIEDMIDFIVGKVLDQAGISHALYPRWIGPTSNKEIKP